MRVSSRDVTVSAVREVLLNFPAVRLAILYGSAARDHLRLDSDIDLGISTGSRADGDIKQALQLALADRLERDVDLVDLETVEGLLWESLWNDAVFVLWNHDLVVRYAGKVQAFHEDVKPALMATIEARLDRAFGAV